MTAGDSAVAESGESATATAHTPAIDDNVAATVSARRRGRYMPWAELLKRTWKIDLLQRKVRRTVEARRDGIHRFLTGVGLPTGPPGTDPSTTAPTDPAAEPSSAFEFSHGDSFATDPA